MQIVPYLYMHQMSTVYQSVVAGYTLRAVMNALNADPSRPDILLFTINAGYVHPAMGLWYLRANMESQGGLEGFSVDILEVTRRAGNDYIVAEVLKRRPRILAVGLYIWNHLDTLPVLEAVRNHLPDTFIILGGPEASHLPVSHPIFGRVDGVVRGEAELVFPPIAAELLTGRDGEKKAVPREARVTGRGHWVVDAPPPDLSTVRLPHHLFSDHDIERRFMYLEASRGCPFRCQFCLSSLDRKIRPAPLDQLFDMSDHLIRRGATRFKFIDRTFNLDYSRAAAVLEFWLNRVRPGMTVQFETVPDRFPRELRDVIRRFPPDTLRLEVGVQTFNKEVAASIERRSDHVETERTMAFLSNETAAVVHADLIVGLPGESLESFATGFDRLYRYRPGEIQVGILKRLPGAPIAAHDARMRYSADPPYDVLETDRMTESEIEHLKRFAKYWELVVNRGRFPGPVARLLDREISPFYRFYDFSGFCWRRFGRTWGLAPEELAAALDAYMSAPDGADGTTNRHR